MDPIMAAQGFPLRIETALALSYILPLDCSWMRLRGAFSPLNSSPSPSCLFVLLLVFTSLATVSCSAFWALSLPGFWDMFLADPGRERMDIILRPVSLTSLLCWSWHVASGESEAPCSALDHPCPYCPGLTYLLGLIEGEVY